jgi:hypothetical protein
MIETKWRSGGNARRLGKRENMAYAKGQRLKGRRRGSMASKIIINNQ